MGIHIRVRKIPYNRTCKTGQNYWPRKLLFIALQFAFWWHNDSANERSFTFRSCNRIRPPWDQPNKRVPDDIFRQYQRKTGKEGCDGIISVHKKEPSYKHENWAHLRAQCIFVPMHLIRWTSSRRGKPSTIQAKRKTSNNSLRQEAFFKAFVLILTGVFNVKVSAQLVIDFRPVF